MVLTVISNGDELKGHRPFSNLSSRCIRSMYIIYRTYDNITLKFFFCEKKTKHFTALQTKNVFI